MSDHNIGPRAAIKAAAVGLYDLQKLRIQTGQRIVAHMKVLMGIEPGSKEDLADDFAKDLLKKLRAEYRTLSEGASRTITRKSFKPISGGLITDYSAMCMVTQWAHLVQSESTAAKQIESLVETHPLHPWLDEVKGCGRLMSSIIISYLDVHKAHHASCFWSYCGLDVGPDGHGRSRRKEHLIDREYTNADGEVTTRKSTTYNPFVKTKLRGVLAECLLKAQGHYSKVYYDYRHRLENHAKYGIHNDGQKADDRYDSDGKYIGFYHGKKKRHEMAMRYMIKIFLMDLWVYWRELEGLPVTPSYEDAKLGHHQYAAAGSASRL